MDSASDHQPLAKAALTPRMIAEGALSLAHSEGLEAVTIRRLAKDVGVTPMAIYWHFQNKDALLDGMVDRIFERVDTAVDASQQWQQQLRRLLTSLVDALRANPAMAVLVATRTAASQNTLQATETTLGILRRAGFSPVEATQVARHAVGTASNLVGGIPGGGDHPPTETTDRDRQARAYLESLSPQQFPHIVEASRPLSECEDPDAYFNFGLDLLLAGIESMAPRTHQP